MQQCHVQEGTNSINPRDWSFFLPSELNFHFWLLRTQLGNTRSSRASISNPAANPFSEDTRKLRVLFFNLSSCSNGIDSILKSN
jgi:hypothetical protein